MISHNIAIVSALVGGIIVGILLTMAAFAVLATYGDDEPALEEPDVPVISPIIEPRKKQPVYDQEKDYSFGGIKWQR